MSSFGTSALIMSPPKSSVYSITSVKKSTSTFLNALQYTLVACSLKWKDDADIENSNVEIDRDCDNREDETKQLGFVLYIHRRWIPRFITQIYTSVLVRCTS